MKKNKIIYTSLLGIFIIAIGMIIFKYNKGVNQKNEISYQLLVRKGNATPTAEWNNARGHFDQLEESIKANPNDTKSMIALANLFILEGRATGNYTYYDLAAMKFVNDVLLKEPHHFDALTLKALVLLSQHHFSEGLAVARTAQQINPYNAFLYGVMVDAAVELGHYDSAVHFAEQMMSIRPDLRSYARASYLREIHGDHPGAIQAMKLAIDAGMPGDEATEWSRAQLGQLYENVGDMKAAEELYMQSLNARPGYVHALAGMARIATANKDYNKAIHYYQSADSLVGNITFKENMADVYFLMGKKQEALDLSKFVVDEMASLSAKAATDESIGHYADKELAYAYLRTGNLDKALEHAIAEYNRRPLNIDVNETLAWVYYEKGDYSNATKYIKTAISTHSKNPVLLSRAGLIFQKAGDMVKAKQFLEAALVNHPNIPQPLKTESELALKKMDSFAKI